MAGTSLLALIDDIATLLDDVSAMTKVAAQKTAGVLGDDLALNAEQVTGVVADRELPVVFAVAKGSLINKAILVPGALAISALIPWLITPLLMLGGAFLCFEGFEKVAHKLLHPNATSDDELDPIDAVKDATLDPVAFEKAKIKGAIRTDFILSAEIIVISLGVVSEADFMSRVGVLVAISLGITIGVYGLVAGIVKLDDFGLYLTKKDGAAAGVGRAILVSAPWLMKGLGIVGTIAMFLVGGGILLHGIPGGEVFANELAHKAGALHGLAHSLIGGFVGVVAGGIIVGVVTGIHKAMGKH